MAPHPSDPDAPSPAGSPTLAPEARDLFYRLDGAVAVGAPRAALEGYRTLLWRPRGSELRPPGVRGTVFLVWWLLHRLRVFRNREYGVLLVFSGNTLVHRSGVYPGYLRFPFMADQDLQIGDTWTHEGHRGRGLATHAIREIVARCARPGRRFWYLVEASNAASIRVIEKAGFTLVGEGRRIARFGIRLLGAYVMDAAGADEVGRPVDAAQ